MLFGILLIVGTAGARLAARGHGTRRDHARRGLALAMVVAGLAHLVGPDPFVQHLPDWVPGRTALVAVTGVVEIALGLALVGRRGHRTWAGRLLALYLVAVWPANVYVAIEDVDVDGQPGGAYAWIRLPLQVVFIAWALWSTRAEIAPSTAQHGEPTAIRRAVAVGS